MYSKNISTLLFSFICSISWSLAQTIETPSIIEVREDDRVATIMWNSKTDIYDFEYDPDKRKGIYSYLIEWGPVSEGFINSNITPYRAHMCQPLMPGVMYQARVYALDTLGRKSAASEAITFQHDASRVVDMRQRLNGFFDDFNQSVGAFEERDWNQSYSGCMAIGKVSQHINNQFHAHNVIASDHCDRAAASSRVRHPFDFTNRTGVIEFDLDGSQRNRQFWYLDLSPYSRKRDLTAHTSVGSSNPSISDPPHLLRIAEIGNSIEIQLADHEGRLFTLPSMFENGACGDRLVFCQGQNLNPLINVRRHWRIELSKTAIKIFIDGIKIIDGSLISEHSPNGLEYEVAQVNWLTFSYNTTKDNFVLSMIHWDNFGFDAPPGYNQETVVHNYTDGELGSEAGRTGNERSVGKVASMEAPATSYIPIPDNILDQNGNLPIKAELMFCIQGGDYNWSEEEYITINNTVYNHPEPKSQNPSITSSEFLGTIQPYSAIIEIDPNDLINGINEIQFFLNRPRLLNIHIELLYPIASAPTYSPPHVIHADYITKQMQFRESALAVGPGIVFEAINDTRFWTLESEYQPTPEIDRWYIYEEPVSDQLVITLRANSEAQMGALGTAEGISYYEIWIDKEVVYRQEVNMEHEVAQFANSVSIDLSPYANGIHELFVQGYDIHGNPSIFDAFQAHATSGKYLPTLINIQNLTTSIDLLANDTGISLYPNPTNGEFVIKGDLVNYNLQILDILGMVHQDISTIHSETVISIDDLPSGMYFLRVVNQNNSKIDLEIIIKQ